MLKRYKIKPYRSYYHYRQRRLKLVRMLISSSMAAVLVGGFMLCNPKGVTTFINKTQKAAQASVNTIDDMLYLEGQDIAYNVYAEAEEIKAVYLPAGYMQKLDSLIELAETTEVNAFVIDVKDDYGYLTFASENPKLQQIVKKHPPIESIQTVMNRLYKNDIFPIARIVAFKDKAVAQTHPERMVHTKTGEVFQTPQGETWLNPYDRTNWPYILTICEEAVDVGFKEIQFDYVRFHESMKDSVCDFPEGETKTEVITAFIDYIYDHLHERGVKVSADVFGTIITSSIDASVVGQDYKELMKHLDYICPMIYPSHYAEGSFGIAHPDLQPYDLILQVMQYSNNIIKEIPREDRRAKVRPWLQDFTATWVQPHQTYGEEEVEEQIKGVYDALINEWILWNAAGKYSTGGIGENSAHTTE